jgi:hypothetical protein
MTFLDEAPGADSADIVSMPGDARVGTLCSATFDSERFWCDSDSIRLPAVVDPAQDRIVATLDELLFPFCPNPRDVLLTRQQLPSSQRDYLRSLGFDFENRVTGTGPCQSDPLWPARRYFYSPYAILPNFADALVGWHVTNSLPPLEAVRCVNSKLYSWELRCDVVGKLGEQCFSAADVRIVAAGFLAQERKAVIKEGYGVSGRGNVLIEGTRMLDRICRHIDNAERKGGKAEFVVEPLLAKKRDFSCHFALSPTGSLRQLGIQSMTNRGMSFYRIEQAEPGLVALLQQSDYFRVMERVGKALFEKGYFGPVCVDSMLTEEGLVPLVEINARKSMGLINIHLNQQLGEPGRRIALSFRNLRVPQGFSHDSLLERLEARRSLYLRTRGHGIAVLNARGLAANLASPQETRGTGNAPERSPMPRAAGRLYFAILSDSAAEEAAIEQSLMQVLSELGIQVF